MLASIQPLRVPRAQSIDMNSQPSPTSAPPDHIAWVERDAPCLARWVSERGSPPPKRVVLADDTLSADSAYRLACAGTGLLWRGDFNNARQLLQAMARRIDKAAVPSRAKAAKAKKTEALDAAPGVAFHRHRQAQAQRARVLSSVLVQIDAQNAIKLRRAPDASTALAEAWGPLTPQSQLGGDRVVALRELLGLVGAHEWRKKGVEVPALGHSAGAESQVERIHPHYGVFSPLRGEYLAMIAAAPLPKTPGLPGRAFDIGTGTGVIAILLARRGIKRIVATDNDARALVCASANIERLGASAQVLLVNANMFPEGQADLIVCNPPWLPARPGSSIERAVYDEGGAMLNGFLSGVAQHLSPSGEAWLVMSDLAERLGLRSREALMSAIAAGGLAVVERIDTRPTHAKAFDPSDPLHEARAGEITSLWRFKAAN